MGDQGLLYAGIVGMFSAVLLGGLAFVGSAGEPTGVARSLAVIQQLGHNGPTDRKVQPFRERVLVPFMSNLVGIARRLSPAGVNARIQRRLDLAGNPPGKTPERVLGQKGAGLVLGVPLGLFLGWGGATLVIWVAAFGAAGFFLPDILLYNSGIKRQDLLRRNLAEAIDMLTVSVEAGLGFDAALLQVARNTRGPMAGECFRVIQEIQIGKSRTEAFQALAERTSVDELRTFVSALVQADRLGVPIAAVLREQSKEMRLKRRQRAEEQAQKVPVKVLFPLVLFILPVMFVIIMGPGAIQIIRTF